MSDFFNKVGNGILSGITGNPLGFFTNIAGGIADLFGSRKNQQAIEDTNRTNLLITDKNNEANRKLAEYQWEMNLNQWNRENEYNTPLAQMQRYQQAGLNPYLIYGSGTSISGNAGSSPQYQSPTMEAGHVVPETMDYGAAFSRVSQYQLNAESVENLKRLQEAQATAAAADANAKNMRAALDALERTRGEFHFDLEKNAKDSLQKAFKLQNELTESMILKNNQSAFTESFKRADYQSQIDFRDNQAEEISARIGVHKAEARRIQVYTSLLAEKITSEQIKQEGYRRDNYGKTLNNHGKYLQNVYDYTTLNDRIRLNEEILNNCIVRNKNGKIEFDMKKFEYEYARVHGEKLPQGKTASENVHMFFDDFVKLVDAIVPF